MMLRKLSQPLFGLRFASVAICLIGLARIFCTVMLIRVLALVIPPDGFDMVLDDLCKTSGITSKALFLYLFIVSFLVSLISVICGIFLFFRRSWARKVLISIAILILVNHVIVRLLTHRLSISLGAIFEIAFNIYLLVFFMNRAIVQLFAVSPELPRTQNA